MPKTIDNGFGKWITVYTQEELITECRIQVIACVDIMKVNFKNELEQLRKELKDEIKKYRKDMKNKPRDDYFSGVEIMCQLFNEDIDSTFNKYSLGVSK